MVLMILFYFVIVAYIIYAAILLLCVPVGEHECFYTYCVIKRASLFVWHIIDGLFLGYFSDASCKKPVYPTLFLDCHLLLCSYHPCVCHSASGPIEWAIIKTLGDYAV